MSEEAIREAATGKNAGCPPGKNLNPEPGKEPIRSLALMARDRMGSFDLTIWKPLLKNNDGNVKIMERRRMTCYDIMNDDWFGRNVPNRQKRKENIP